ncbi:MAG TPA: signal peptidase I [Candidatus Acidoferrales bacterium]|jgi:signal peptidase I|nr:signal peptidase I [Candidatus Acidoferrales bacterium]
MTPSEADTTAVVPPGIAEVAPAANAPVVHEHPAGSLMEFFESLLVTILLALFGTTFIVQAFKIPSESMEPTLLVGDHLLVNKFVFEGTGEWYEKVLPYRPILHGDIIVFKFPFDDHPHYVKRVIGLPGDRIHIVNNQVYVNDKKLTEPYVVHDPSGDDPAIENFPPEDQRISQVGLRPEWSAEIRRYIDGNELIVPPGHYFVMGDNRDRSWDSRYWGFVDHSAIMGRPMLIYWSVEATSDDYGDRSVSGSLRGIEQTLVHLPSRTRWHRMLRGID